MILSKRISICLTEAQTIKIRENNSIQIHLTGLLRFYGFSCTHNYKFCSFRANKSILVCFSGLFEKHGKNNTRFWTSIDNKGKTLTKCCHFLFFYFLAMTTWVELTSVMMLFAHPSFFFFLFIPFVVGIFGLCHFKYFRFLFRIVWWW